MNGTASSLAARVLTFPHSYFMMSGQHSTILSILKTWSNMMVVLFYHLYFPTVAFFKIGAVGKDYHSCIMYYLPGVHIWWPFVCKNSSKICT